MSQSRYAKSKSKPYRSSADAVRSVESQQSPSAEHWRPSRPRAENPEVSPTLSGRLFGARGLTISDRQLIHNLTDLLQTNIALMRGEDPDAFVPPPSADGVEVAAEETTKDDASPSA